MQSGATICLALAGMVVPLQGVQGESPLHKRMKKIWSALLTKTTIHYPEGAIPPRSKGTLSIHRHVKDSPLRRE